MYSAEDDKIANFPVKWRHLRGISGVIWLQYVVFQPTKEMYVQLYKESKGMNKLFMDVYWV